jgi:hypothetical protein
MTNTQMKGPLWFVLGVFLFAGVMQLLRVLQLPDTWIGTALRSGILVVAIYAIVSLCIAPLRPRFFLIAYPLVLLSSMAWPPYYRSLTTEGQDVAQVLSALGVGLGLGGTIAFWVMQRRRNVEAPK